jgi:tRNA-specific 2-thiouridylase
MSRSKEKVVVAMSGGVDSSVAACLLAEQGYEVVGLFMRVGAAHPEAAGDAPSAASPNEATCQSSTIDPTAADADRSRSLPIADQAPARTHQGCCSADDAADARFVAGMLGVPFFALNFERDFADIIEYFVDEYAQGRTPNPCIRCNHDLKFGRLLEYADAVGARYIATGHYARVEDTAGHPVLRRGLDRDKDQSYVLFGLPRSVLRRVLLPVGGLTKPEVRRLAERFGLPNRDKPDSVEICFVPDRDYARVVAQHRPDAFQAGDVVDPEGQVVGAHRGLPHYTVGQRRGLGIAAGVPVYVTEINVEDNTLRIGPRDQLLGRVLHADRLNLLTEPPAPTFRTHAQIRYLHRAAPATAHLLGDGRLRLVFDEPQPAITPGQAVVLYDDDRVLGGAWINAEKE